MGTIAGSKKLKRQMAPKFWGITRKEQKICYNSKAWCPSKKSINSHCCFIT